MNVATRGLQLAPGEFKCVDTSVSTDVNTTTSPILLNGIARGDALDERIGRQVLMRSIQFNLRFQVTVGTGIAQFCRCTIVYDKQTNAAALTNTNVFVENTVNAPRLLENRKRFRILYDETFFLSEDATTGCGHVLKGYQRVNLPVEFNSGDAGTVADITTGSLYLVLTGTTAAGDTDTLIRGYVRVRYTDK